MSKQVADSIISIVLAALVTYAFAAWLSPPWLVIFAGYVLAFNIIRERKP